MTDTRTRAAKVGACVDLRGVSLRTVDAHLPVPKVVTAPLSIDVAWSVSNGGIVGGRVAYTYRLMVNSAGEETFSISAEWILDYDVGTGVGFDEADLAAFGDVSVSFSAAPYARELVQSLTTRASLPPLVLPTLRAPIDPPRERDIVAAQTGEMAVIGSRAPAKKASAKKASAKKAVPRKASAKKASAKKPSAKKHTAAGQG